MRRAFCFSRSWVLYSEGWRRRSRPCSPGGLGRRSIGQRTVSHFGPFKNSLTFSRRQRRQTGPVYRAIYPSPRLDPAPLFRAATVVRYRRDVLDPGDLDAGARKRPDGGLTPRAWSPDQHVDAPHAVLHGPAGALLGGHLGGEGGGLARALEADIAGRRPGDDVALLVADRDDRVVERALDVGDAIGDVLAFLAARPSAARLGGLGHRYLRTFFFPATVFFGPLRVRALVWVR